MSVSDTEREDCINIENSAPVDSKLCIGCDGEGCRIHAAIMNGSLVLATEQVEDWD